MENIVNLKEKKPSKLKAFFKKRKKLIIFLLILILLLCIGAIFSSLGKNNAIVMAETDTVIRENLEYHVKVNGTTSASSEQYVVSKAGGTVGKVYVSQGDTVKEGQTLAVIESTDLDKQLKEAQVRINMEKTRLTQSKQGLSSAQSNLSALEISYNLAKQTYDANQKLLAEGAISQITLETSRMEMEQARSQYEQAKRDASNGSYSQNINLQSDSLKLAQLEYAALVDQKNNLVIKSPIAGVVAETLIKDNQTLTVGTQAFYIVDNSKIEIVANVGEYDVQKLSLGDSVAITSEGFAEQYTAEISYISPYAQKVENAQSSQTVVEIKAVITGADTLKAGYSVHLDILCDKKDNILTIPYESILTAKDGKQYVFTVDDENNNTPHVIETGLEGTLRIEVVSSDVKEGDKILLNPTQDTLDAANGADGEGKGDKK